MTYDTNLQYLHLNITEIPNDMTHSDTIHLATSPCTPSGPMLDMQGTLHQSSNNLNEEPQKTDTSPLPETEQPIVDQSEHQTVDDNARPNQNDKTSEGDLNQRPLETETASVAGSQSPDVVPDQVISL